MGAVFGQYFDDFKHFLRFEKRYSPHTLTAYMADLGQFSDYLDQHYDDLSFSKINHFHLRGWLAELKENSQNERSINRKISSINGYYKYLLRKGLVEKNPTGLIHSLRLPERLPTFLKETETENLLEQVSFGNDFQACTDRLILELLYASGMRRSELIHLKEADIEWSLRQIRVLGKGNKERLLPMSEAILDQLRHYLSLKKEANIETATLLALPNGKALYERYVYARVKKYLSQVTTLKKKSPHILRHTFATHLLNNGASIQAIKELLGHSSIAATQVYTHINIDELKKIHKLNHPRG
ncbi:MAG: tyrosine-type recombinase/integrase [Phycisphaerales bacterium]|nr:tyrosine-type recombinase/integrase [Phycisphaerales bacterium]